MQKAQAESGFCASIEQRVLELRAAMDALSTDPGAGRRARVRRRLHALGVGARVVGLQRVAQRVADAGAILDAGGWSEAEEMRAIDEALVTLPELARADAEAPLPLAIAPDTQSAAVCVVGREELLRTLSEAGALGGLTLDCTRAPDCGTALGMREPVTPELFVIDVDMPGASELVSTLIDDPRTELVPIIAIARPSSKERLARWTVLGVARTFVRPLDAAAVRVACVEAIEQRRGRTLRMVAPPAGLGMSAPPGVVAIRAPAPIEPSPLPPAAPAAPIEINLASLVGRRIVVADADPVVTWFIADQLRKHGCVVDEAIGAQRALEHALDVTRAELPHLVFADAELKSADGAPLAHALARDPMTRDVPIVLLSWKDELLDAARASGVVAACMTKGAAPEELVAKAAELVQARAPVWARLCAAGKAPGTLERVSVARLVRAAQARKRPALIVLSSGGVTHELHVARGAIRRAARTSPEGRVEVGARAASTALGTLEGTYVLDDAHEAASGDQDLTTCALDLLRATGRALSTARAERIVELRLDPDAGHLARSLAPRALVERLASGVSPRALVVRGEATSEQLSTLVDDLCRRGIVVGFREEIPDAAARPVAPAPPPALRASPPPAPALAIELSAPITAPLRAAPARETTAPIPLARKSAPRELTPPPAPGALTPPPLPPEPGPPANAPKPAAPVTDIEAPVSLLPAFEVPGSRRARADSEAPVALPVTHEPGKNRLKNASRAALVVVAAIALGAVVRWTAFNTTERRALAGPAAPAGSAARPPQGVLEITLPDEATVLVDGMARGQGPKVSVLLSEGTHEVKTGNGDAKARNIEIARGKVTHVDLTPKLQAVPPATGAPATSAPRPPR
jgi:CheY-like chemotaxis protein